MKRIKFLVTVIMLLAAGPVHALIELRAHFGKWTGKPTDFNTRIESVVVNHPDFKSPDVFGADLLITPPIISWVVGVRHETFALKEKGNVTFAGFPFSAETEVNGSRTSALVGYRILEIPVAHLGILAHYGLDQKADYDLVLGGVKNEYKGKMEASYGIGVEAGVHFGPLLLGAEVGHTVFKAKHFATDGVPFSDSAGAIPFDLSGTYYRVLIGFGI